jgi:hypothetical protein
MTMLLCYQNSMPTRTSFTAADAARLHRNSVARDHRLWQDVSRNRAANANVRGI